MNAALTSEFLCFLGILCRFRITTQDLFRTYILSIAGTTVFRFEKTTKDLAGRQQEHNA